MKNRGCQGKYFLIQGKKNDLWLFPGASYSSLQEIMKIVFHLVFREFMREDMEHIIPEAVSFTSFVLMSNRDMGNKRQQARDFLYPSLFLFSDTSSLSSCFLRKE